jgi:hypothetical protein
MPDLSVEMGSCYLLAQIGLKWQSSQVAKIKPFNFELEF